MMIDPMYLMLYNLVFTSLPPLVLAIFDQVYDILLLGTFWAGVAISLANWLILLVLVGFLVFTQSRNGVNLSERFT